MYKFVLSFYFSFVDFLDEVSSAFQIKKYASALLGALLGALLSACQNGVGLRILMKNRNKQDGTRSWCQLVQQYETEGSRNFRIQ
jgi:hypothetical protein